MLIKSKNFIKNFIYKIVPPPNIYKQTFSQAGEDVIIHFLFSEKNIQKISYLDIGTNIPNYGNNTYLFYLEGNTGVCIEADKKLIPQIEKIRPKDKVINAGISNISDGEADFYIFDMGMNTFDKDEMEYRTASGKYKLLEVVKVPMQTINSVIKKNFNSYPDLLSIDIEGLDFSVIKTLDFHSFPIPVICIETCIYSENHVRPKDNRIQEFLESTGYERYADTYINTIFINKKWFYK